MRIMWLIPGSGESFYCENCLRDYAMIGALRTLGHDVLMVPMYLPLSPEGSAAKTPPRGLGGATPLFFGGINVYLRQKWALLAHMPGWLRGWLDRPGLLKAAGRMSGMVKAADLKQTLISMLRGEEGRQAMELERLTDYLTSAGADVVVLSNALLLGLAKRIKGRLKVPVACYLQDEDEFIDALDAAGRQEVWAIVRERSLEVDLFIAASRYYADKVGSVLCGTGILPASSMGVPPMTGCDAPVRAARHEGRMPSPHAGETPAAHMGKMPMPRMEVVYAGIAMSEYGPPRRAWPEPPVIGFLSRRCYSKGPDLLAEAFCRLKADARLSGLKLRLAGGMLADDKPLERQIRRRLAKASVLGDVEFLPHMELPRRAEFLRGLSVLSVPQRIGEAGGRYVKEALACGVPVVQPQNGVFPELLAATGGGLLFPPGDVDALTRQLTRVLTEPQLAESLATQGRAAVAELFSAQRSAEELITVLQNLLS
jgi:glycosyltransferase involved in cell wall biosynthesis